MFQALREAFFYELRAIFSSYYKMFLLTLLPLLSFALLIAIFYKVVVHNLPIVIVDHDRSQLSRKLLHNIDDSATMKISYRVDSTKEALLLIQSAKAYAAIIIPKHFQRDVLNKTQPKVTAMINTQYILVGKIINAALSQTLLFSAAEVEFVQDLTQTSNRELSKRDLNPIGLQVSSFFNTYQNYFLFLVSALLPSVWQIFIVVVTLVSFGSLFKEHKEREFFYDQYIFARIIGKLLPYTLTYTLLGILFLFFIYGTMGWVFEGSFAVTIFAQFLTVIAYQGIALLFFVTGFDYARSLSLGAVYTAPAFAFLGVTFPVYNMNGFALFWRDMLPISHYMELQISQANYGAELFLELERLSTIALFFVVYIPVYFMFKRRLSR
jgi:ABC-2 type transport system permease protein